MSSTDDRIVKMEFDNAQFKKGAAETKQSLADVNKSIDAAGKSKGLLDLNSNMQQVGVTASKMAIVTTTALATITNKAVNAGLSLVSSLTLDPLKQGFSEYQSMLTKQNVIMNATGKSAQTVKNTLNQLNKYSDQTIYSFGNMTDAVQKFVNAGVPLGQSVKSIKGIANAAAFAGASSEEANRAMYAFSQSMSLGFIQLQDWNQIENANMGTVQFKNTLLEAGVAAGTLTKRGKEYITSNGKAITATKGWRDGLQSQWATTEVLNKALGKYNDNTTKLGRKAFKAATQVRTFSAFMDTLKESIGSGWSGVFATMIGGLEHSTAMWTGLSNTIGGGVNALFNFAISSLHAWRRMHGLAKTLEGFRNIASPFIALFKAIKTAMNDAFPSSNKGVGKGLYFLSYAFEALTTPLTWLAKLITQLTPVLTTFFQIIRIGGVAIGDVVKYVSDFVSGIAGMLSFKAPSGGGFLGWVKDVAKAIGDAVQQITDFINKGGSLKDAFKNVHFKLPKLDLGGLFGGGKGGGFSNPLAGVGESISKMAPGLGKVKGIFAEISGGAKDAGTDAKSAGQTIGETIKNVGKWIGELLGKIDFDKVIASLNLAVLSTFMISLSRMFNTLSGAFKGFVGFGDNVNNVLTGASDALKAYQKQANAKKIMYYAIAIGILAASLWVLSRIPVGKLVPALAAMGAVFLMLNGTMKTLTGVVDKFDGVKTSVNLIAVSVGIVALGVAMILLATACLIMNKVKWTSIAKGITVMYVAMKLMEGIGGLGKEAAKNMASGAFAIALIAGSMIILAAALLLFQLVKWESIGKAGVVLGGLTLAVGALAMIPYAGIAKVGMALLTASVGMLAMANALIIFGIVKWESIGKAAVMLLLLTASLAALMFVGGPVAISGMVSLAAAMIGLATAGLILNKVDWESIGKIGAILGLLVLGVAAFAAVLTVFLYAVAPVSPVLMVLGAGFALLGLGLLAFAAAMAIAITLGAAGVAAFAALATGAAVAIAVFMQTLAMEAPILKNSFLMILQALIDTIVEAVPMIIQGIKRLWAAVKAEFTSQDKQKGMGDTGKSWMQSLMDKIKEKIPEIAAKGVEILKGLIRGMVSKASSLGGEAAKFVAKFIQGIADNIGGVITAGGNLIAAFITGIGSQSARLAQVAFQTIVDFVNELAKTVRKQEPLLIQAFSNLGVQMVMGLIDGLTGMFGQAMGAIGHLASGLVDKAKSILKIFSPSRVFRDIGQFLVLGLTNGIQDNAVSAINAVASMVGGQIAVASSYISAFIQKLDQQAIAAKAKADGLALAAEKAEKAANKTKNKKDDKAAAKIGTAAEKASKAADAAQARADAAKEASDRADEFNQADTLTKAQMRSEDAQNQMDAAKAAEANAARDLAAANALAKQAKAKGVSAKERKSLEKQAADLRARAAQEAANANAQLAAAKASAGDALAYQKKAGDEAAAAFQLAFDNEAKAAAEADAFEKMTDADKAKLRREQAAALETQAAKDLADAKQLAYTDLEAANTLAQTAMDEAEKARQYIDDATQFEQSASTNAGGSGAAGTVVNLTPTDMAAAGFDYGNGYDPSIAANGGGPTIEFNQYNTSPESLSPSEIYRQTHNQLAFAEDKLVSAAA